MATSTAAPNSRPRWKTPIQIGEKLSMAPRELRKACDFVMLGSMRMGGVTGWASLGRHLRRCRRAHVHASLSRSRGPSHARYGDGILQQHYEIKGGQLHIPNLPGVGLQWNQDAVAAYLVDL